MQTSSTECGSIQYGYGLTGVEPVINECKKNIPECTPLLEIPVNPAKRLFDLAVHVYILLRENHRSPGTLNF